VPYEVLNKKFRAAQKVLDREASGVAQAGSEIEKLLADFPPISISPTSNIVRHATAMELGDNALLVSFDSATTGINHNIAVGDEDNSAECGEMDDAGGTGDFSRGGGLFSSIGNSVESETLLLEDNSESNSNNSVSIENNKSAVSEDVSGSRANKPKVKGRDVAKLLGVLVDRLGSLKRKV
jgi:hypothetical protein